MADCLPCSRGAHDGCAHPTCTCDHDAPALVFGPCPDAPDCNLPHCDGTDLGHDLAAEFPTETERVDEALADLRMRSRRDVLTVDTILSTPHADPTFTCYRCGITFDKDPSVSDGDANADCQRRYPDVDPTNPNEVGSLCDACNVLFRQWAAEQGIDLP